MEIYKLLILQIKKIWPIPLWYISILAIKILDQFSSLTTFKAAFVKLTPCYSLICPASFIMNWKSLYASHNNKKIGLCRPASEKHFSLLVSPLPSPTVHEHTHTHANTRLSCPLTAFAWGFLLEACKRTSSMQKLPLTINVNLVVAFYPFCWASSKLGLHTCTITWVSKHTGYPFLSVISRKNAFKYAFGCTNFCLVFLPWDKWW